VSKFDTRLKVKVSEIENVQKTFFEHNNLTMRPHKAACLVSIIYAPLGKSARIRLMDHTLVSSRLDYVNLIPYCSVVHRSTQLFFNAYSMHSPES